MASTPPQLTPTRGDRIHYIDGIRAFAALAVVVLHVLQMRGLRLETTGLIPGFDYSGSLTESLFSDLIRMLTTVFLNVGTMAVELFIVISGYTIMMSIVRSKDGLPKGGIRGYMKRRIKRIWPPYYAALIISIAIILFVPGMGTPFNNRYHDLHLPLTLENAATHALFIHNWFPEHSLKINAPLWTIAVEEQIYLLFPFVLLPFWRRMQGGLMIVSAAVIGFLPMLVLPYEVYHSSHLWYLVLFSLGATGVSINFSGRPRESIVRDRVPWALVGVIILGIWLGITKLSGRLLGLSDDTLFRLEPLTDIVFGGAMACFMVHLTETWKRGKPRLSFLAVFDSRPAVMLGIFSYSIYLMHAPVLALTTRFLRGLGIDGEPLYVFLIVLGIPLVIIVTYAFHLVFERPFMPPGARKLPKSEPAEKLSHATAGSSLSEN
jgi:peptidoglycan/LPS O-acetylase OafA/YrhL